MNNFYQYKDLKMQLTINKLFNNANSFMKILVICPVPPEFKECCNELSLKAHKRTGKMENKDNNSFIITALHTGPGEKNVKKRLGNSIMEYKPDLIIDSGSCCSLDNRINIGDIIIAEESYKFRERIYKKSFISCMESEKAGRWFLKITRIAEKRGNKVIKGVQVTDSFVFKSEKTKNRILNSVKAHAYNWETSSVFDLSDDYKIPAVSFRIVTDLGNNSFAADFFRNIKVQSKRLYSFLKVLIDKKVFDMIL
jgi:nucleoside phosphorylase